ncbi:BlaI/MecI/CopY family transcriptional regulator [Novipirellula artificiosorum]|uniref:Penicillinase repressor n=1 Tax=Novipirellula artificiosorum TaxID=2528016 RepID=A0A5C6DTC4_9BACT|nr:BlaI/MecI/CopY family transcriptional regulator [Novipirellula artificiosorum]TWU40563.1 Penicillinase repressor [Novipirellula artificiosorum]
MSQFTAGELEVMQILWEHGELKPAEIQAVFPREIKNPALRSVLVILVDKGHVSRRQVGKAFFYKARTHRNRAFRSMLRELADQFCEGSTRTLLFNLVQSEKLSDDDIAELERLAKDSSPLKEKRSES